MNLLSRAEILYSLSVLEGVRITEVFSEEMYENFVRKFGNCAYLRGSTVQEMVYYILFDVAQNILSPSYG